MDAKQRYRERLKLQGALGRVLETLAVLLERSIPPDRTSALLAWQVIGALDWFVKEAVPDPEELTKEPDFARVLYLKKARRKETYKRYRRERRQ
jgi:hypothetical protein